MLKCICVLIDVNRHTHKNKDQYRSWKIQSTYHTKCMW